MSFLPGYIRACMFVLFALAAARVYLHFMKFQHPQMSRWFGMWCLLTVTAFLSHSMLLFIAVFAFAYSRWKPKTLSEQAAFAIAVLPVLPKFQYIVPGALGINYLFVLDYVRILTVIILVPILVAYLKLPPKERSKSKSWIDVFVAGYFTWMCLLAFRTDSLTDGLRGVFDMLVFGVVPYVVFSRAFTRLEDFDDIAAALVFSAMMVAFIALVEQRLDWWFYRYLPEVINFIAPEWFGLGHYQRGGFVRVKSTMDGGLAYFMIFGVVALLYMYRDKSKGLFFYATAGIFGLVLFFTGARGSLLAGVMALALMFIFRLIQTRWRTILLAAAALIAMPTVNSVIASYQDDYGTFHYRQQLLESAVPLIVEKFWFGFSSMRELELSGRLEHMRQGEGIIDIVNSYLQVGLFSGGLGLFLFMGILLGTLFRLLKVHEDNLKLPADDGAYMRKILIAMLLSTMFLIATVSMVGYIPDYFWLLLALCRSYIAVAHQTGPRSKVEVETRLRSRPPRLSEAR